MTDIPTRIPALPPRRRAEGDASGGSRWLLSRTGPILTFLAIMLLLTMQLALLRLHHRDNSQSEASALVDESPWSLKERSAKVVEDEPSPTGGKTRRSMGDLTNLLQRNINDLRQVLKDQKGKPIPAAVNELAKSLRRDINDLHQKLTETGGKSKSNTNILEADGDKKQNQDGKRSPVRGSSEASGAERQTRETPEIPKETSKAAAEKQSRETREVPEKPLNILLLYGDDWRHDVFGAAGGNPVILTPNLNKLAEEGLMFTHNCVTTSICGISRATLQTGQYYSRHQCNPHQRGGYPEPIFHSHWNETLNGLLRDAGYYVGLVGKWQIKNPPRRKFDVFNEYYGFHMNNKGQHITELNERHTLDFLEKRPKDKPFFLTVSFFATHALDNNPLQYVPQNRSLSMYRDVSVPVPPNGDDAAWKRLPSNVFQDHTEARSRWRQRYKTPDMFQHHMKNMYRMASEVDTASGRIIQQLKEEGVLDNTLIIFTTDNGNIHGEHGIAEKWFPHQESIRVPLIIKDPRMPTEKVGKTNSDLTLNIDLAPTIISAAGIKVPERMQGTDMADLYLDKEGQQEKKPWRQSFYYEHPEIDCSTCIPGSEAVVVKDSEKYHKLMRWTAQDVYQFFDLNADPIEENDLIGSEDHKGQIDSLRALLGSARLGAK